MGKKSKKVPSGTTAGDGSTSAAVQGASAKDAGLPRTSLAEASSPRPSPSTPTTLTESSEAARVTQAFAVGNYSFVRRMATSAPSEAARQAAQALLPRVVIDWPQVGMGLAGLLVVLTACALTLRGAG
jgi:hypothetical protein